MYNFLLTWYVENRASGMYGAQKQQYFSGISKESILELGAGGGVNFKWYPKGSHITVIEPNTKTHSVMHSQAKKYGHTLTVHTDPDALKRFTDSSFQTVLDTLVLCSVHDVPETLAHIHRVLRSGGSYYFIEHIQAPEGTFKKWLQNFIGPVWKRATGGCSCTRTTDKSILKQFPKASYTYFTPIQLHHPLTSNLFTGKATK